MSAVLSSLVQLLPTGTLSGSSSLPPVSIGGLEVQATIEEAYYDSIEVTEHPVESGASITDHSFRRPSELVLRCGWSNSSDDAQGGADTAQLASGGMAGSDYVSGIYSQLLALQQSRTLFSVSTTLRVYENMLLTVLHLPRDQKVSQAIIVTAHFREILVTSATTTSLPSQSNQANPASTAQTQQVGTASLTPGSPAPGGSIPPSDWSTTQ